MEELSFPSNHYWHNTVVEWVYFWGRLDSGEFFHFAEFVHKMGAAIINARHWSYNGQYHEEIDDNWKSAVAKSGYTTGKFSFSNPIIGLTFYPQCKPITHSVKGRHYYSIPYLKGEGFIYPNKEVSAQAWFDHEWRDNLPLSNLALNAWVWDWISLKMDCGISVMAYDQRDNSICDITLGDKTIESKFILDGKHLFLHATGMYLTLEPLFKEEIFDPKFGFKYSEQPFNVISKGELIGYGMRERTYHGNIQS